MPYLLTFSTYGSYLPGDSRGSTDRHIGCREAEPRLEDHVRKTMIETRFPLEPVSRQAGCTGRHRGALRAKRMVVGRPQTHLHIVVDADVAPERILQACKAYATRALKGIQAGFWQAPFTMCWTAKERGWKSTPEMTAHKIPQFHRGPGDWRLIN